MAWRKSKCMNYLRVIFNVLSGEREWVEVLYIFNFWEFMRMVLDCGLEVSGGSRMDLLYFSTCARRGKECLCELRSIL